MLSDPDMRTNNIGRMSIEETIETYTKTIRQPLNNRGGFTELRNLEHNRRPQNLRRMEDN